jgi:hypothetical protein
MLAVHGFLLLLILVFLIWIVPWFTDYFGLYDF